MKKYLLMLSILWLNSVFPIAQHFTPQDPRFKEMKKLFLPIGKIIVSLVPAYTFGAADLLLRVGMGSLEKIVEISLGKKRLLLESMKNGDVESFKRHLFFFINFYNFDSSSKLKAQINKHCLHELSKKEMIRFVNQQRMLAKVIGRKFQEMEQSGFEIAKKLD